MLKTGSKRRRTKAEMLEEQKDDGGLRENYEFACSEAARVKRENDLMKGQLAAAVKAQRFTDTMIQEGYVKVREDGEIVPVPEEERQQFQEIQPSPKK